VTYYKVEFLPTAAPSPTSKTFRTLEQGQKYAKRILGFAEDRDVQAKVNIVAVDSKRRK
jgi:hypothetical protein